MLRRTVSEIQPFKVLRFELPTLLESLNIVAVRQNHDNSPSYAIVVQPATAALAAAAAAAAAVSAALRPVQAGAVPGPGSTMPVGFTLPFPVSLRSFPFVLCNCRISRNNVRLVNRSAWS